VAAWQQSLRDSEATVVTRSSLCCLLVLAFLLLAGCGPTDQQSASAPAAATPTPELARDFTLTTLDGESVSLSDYRGQWVLLNFWATWCSPCVEEMPYLSRLAAERDLVVLGINFKEDAASVAQFVAEKGIDFPILLEPDDITLLYYGVRGLPRTFLIAPDGALAHTAIGALRPAEFSARLDALGVERR
jgi:thiol-disulfide isomerase/thioredoxin